MTATNHALTGAIIGLTVQQPLLALSLALLSHFVLDSTPHYTDSKLKITSSAFNKMLIVDIMLCLLLALFLTIARPEHWFLACWCAFLATSPDLMWLPHYARARMGKAWHEPTYALARLHAGIQRYTNPRGWILEAAWAIGCLGLLAKLVNFL